MGLLLKYGDYSFPLETTLVPISSVFEHSAAGGLRRVRETWRIRTVFTPSHAAAPVGNDDEADIKSATDELEAAMRVATQVLTLYQTDGTTPTAHSVTVARLLGINYPEPTGPELATRRTAEITFEAFENIGSDRIVSFQESLAYSGGNERYVVIPTIEGPPKRFKVADETVFRCVQRGSSASRALPYPFSPGPRFPNVQVETVDATFSTARTADGELRYITNWEYRFESPTRLTGKPSTWGTEV